MTVRLYAPALMALALVAACAPTTGAPAVATAADSAAVAALRDAEVAAVTTGDSTLAYMAADIVIMPPNEPAVVGVAGARAWFAGLMSQFTATVTYPSTSVVFSGDLAVEQYVGTITLTPLGGGEPIVEVAKGLHIYRRDAAGAWKMIYDVWNTDIAAAPAPVPVP